MTREIRLTQGKVALVDDEDYERVNQYKWTAVKTFNGKWYAQRKIWVASDKPQITVYLHRFILDAVDGIEIDHIDGDGFNCTRSNLRVATHSQNMFNRAVYKNNTSGYRGVCWDKSKQKWAAQLAVRGRHIFIGRFESKEDAARAYNKAAIQYFGEFASLNEIGEN